MPIYEYCCEHCGHALEKIQKINDPALVECPVCGQPKLKKQISAAGFRLKGSGWYETDFKKGNQKNLHESGEKAAPAKPAETASSDKPATVAAAPSAPAVKPSGA